MGAKLKPAARWILGLALAVGLAMLVIGFRFLSVPQQAARFFGIGSPPGPFDLHYVVALRDLWVGFLLAGLVGLREWRALALCLGLGSLVCLGDAIIVASSSGSTAAIAFHSASGVYCAVVAWMAARRALT